MATLPSFVELMATLGIDDDDRSAEIRRPTARYCPYSRHRTGSISSSSDLDPAPAPPRRRRRAKLTINVCGSTSDLAASTPISTYVRRKSPTSPSFGQDSGYESASPPPHTPSVPTLPVLLPSASASSDSFPTTNLDTNRFYRIVRSRRLGVRISAPSSQFSESYSRNRSA